MNCSSCTKELPSGFAFKFCPFCGATLAAVAPAKVEASDVHDTVEDVEPVSETLVGRPGVAVEVDSEAATVFEMPAVDVSDLNGPMSENSVPALGDTMLDEGPSQARASNETQKSKKKASKRKPQRVPAPSPAAAAPKKAEPEAPADDTIVESSEKPTVVMPALTESAIQKMLAQEEVKEPAIPHDQTLPDGHEKAFSETAWFMQAVTPEALAEAEGEAMTHTEADIMTDRYRTQETLPDEVRREYSLSADQRAAEAKKRRGRRKRKK